MAEEVGSKSERAPGSCAPPSALERFGEIARRVRGAGGAVLLLDYDGTLTEIVERPDEARLAERRRQLLRELAERYPLAVVSGRDLRDVRERVGLPDVVYAGSHGFQIEGPPGSKLSLEVASEFLPELDRAEEELRRRLRALEGALVERKRFSVAAHLRRVAPGDRAAVEEAVGELARHHPRLAIGRGHEVRELRPAVDWNKGRAVEWILGRLAEQAPPDLAIYVGDDRTDEDVFVLGRTLGVVVKREERPSAADYSLRDPSEVERFLAGLLELAG